MGGLSSPEVTAGRGLVTVACRAGYESGLLVDEEYHLLVRPEAQDVCLPCRGQQGQLPRVGMCVS
jgi:hypothetical protein